MSKDIWHTADITPDPCRILICKTNKGQNYTAIIPSPQEWNTMILPEFYNLGDIDNAERIEQYAYLDDLIALETENKDLSDKIGKLELELERTRKALDKAKKENEDKQAVLNCVVDMLKTLNQKYALIMGKDVIKETVRLLEQNKGGDNE